MHACEIEKRILLGLEWKPSCPDQKDRGAVRIFNRIKRGAINLKVSYVLVFKMFFLLLWVRVLIK